MADDVDYYRRCREVFIKPPEMPLRVQHAGPLGLPLRLRAVPRPRAALLPVADRDHRPLQPALPDLLRGQRAVAAAVPQRSIRSSACSTRSCATRASRTSCRSPAASRRSTRSSSPSSTRPRRRPIKHLMVNTNGMRIAERRGVRRSGSPSYMPGFEVYLQFDSFERDALHGAARRRPARRAPARARAAERARHLDDAGGHAEEGPERRRDRARSSTSRWSSRACAA